MSEPSSATAATVELAARVGIDWADQKHFWCCRAAGSETYERGTLANTPEAVDAWAVGLRERFAGRTIGVSLEQSRGPLVNLLSNYAHLELYPVPPLTAAHYRKTFRLSGAKDDAGDCAMLLDLLERHPERIRRLHLDTPETRRLQILVENRRRMVDEKTRHCNRLRDCLKQFFPQVLAWFDQLDAPVVGALLESWANLQALQRAHRGTLARFFRRHHCRGEERIRELIDAIYQSMPATQDEAVLRGGITVALGEVRVLTALRQSIAVYDREIAEIVASHPDAPIFSSLPGAGPVMTSRLIVAFGTRRDRYAGVLDVLAYSGIAPIQEASGKSVQIRFRHSCAQFLRQTFHEYAAISIRFPGWAKDYYDAQRAKGKAHHSAVRALAYKWVRIIFRCWKQGKPYDGHLYETRLAERNSPLRRGTTKLEWEPIAGFQKITAIEA